MNLLDAATHLAEVANAISATYEDTMDAAQLVLSAAEHGDAALDDALRILLAGVRAEDDERAGIAATVCGALVERGADAQLATEHIVERFVTVTQTVGRYVDRCRVYFQEHILSDEAYCEVCGPGDDEQDIMMPQVREAVSETFAEGEAAWIAFDLFCRPTVSVLTRDPDTRRALGRDTELVNQIGALAMHQPGAFYVWALLSLLDDERLVVIDPDSSRGWEVRIDGVADNFQLHLLLADALHRAGALGDEPPDPEVVAALTGSGPPFVDEHVPGYWNLYNWTGLSAEGQLPDGYFDQGSQHWIWNEGVPADIRTLDERRIVLLGPAPVIRQWRPARLFEPIAAVVEVERELPDDDLQRWFARIKEEVGKARDLTAAEPAG